MNKWSRVIVTEFGRQSNNEILVLLTAKPGPFHYTAVALNFFNHYFKIKPRGFQVRTVKT